jgi:hypothetical protein
MRREGWEKHPLENHVRNTEVQNGRQECPTAQTESPYSEFGATKFYSSIILLYLIQVNFMTAYTSLMELK